MLPGRQAHLRLGRCADALHASAVRRDDLLDRRRGVDRHRDDARGLSHGEAHERARNRMSSTMRPLSSTTKTFSPPASMMTPSQAPSAGTRTASWRCSSGNPRTSASRYSRDDPVHGDHVDIQRAQELREELRGGAVRVVDDDLRLGLGDLLASRNLGEERVAVRGADPGRLIDPPTSSYETRRRSSRKKIVRPFAPGPCPCPAPGGRRT